MMFVTLLISIFSVFNVYFLDHNYHGGHKSSIQFLIFPSKIGRIKQYTGDFGVNNTFVTYFFIEYTLDFFVFCINASHMYYM